MEQLKQMKQQLTSIVQSQLGHVETTDTKELGEAVDMIKDLAEAIYYCAITEAMEGEDKEKSSKNMSYYTKPEYYPDYSTPDRIYYYGGSGNGGNGNSSNTSYYDGYNSGHSTPMNNMRGNNPAYVGSNGMMMRDSREGRSPMSRKMYMESKEMHRGTDAQMKELEKYMQELTKDMTEMIEDASPEEKQMLQQKISMLASKIK